MPGNTNLRVGNVVQLEFAGLKRRARVIEDRGNIGVDGERLLRIEFVDNDPGTEAMQIELPAARVTRADRPFNEFGRVGAIGRRR